MKKGKKIIFLTLIMLICQCLGGCGILLSQEDVSAIATNSTKHLSSGQYYVWHDPDAKDITEDLKGVDNEENVFFPVYEGNTTFVGDEISTAIGSKNRIIWALNDSEQIETSIPTLYSGDKLIYYSQTEIPEKFVLERFEDVGNTFGIAGLYKLASERYAYSFSNNEIYEKSDMARVLKLSNTTETIIFDRISSVTLNENVVNDAGIIEGVKGGESYDFDIYAGTIKYPATLKADTRAFVSMEAAYTYDYDLPQAEIAVLQLPEFLKTGYYYINGTGLFRYIANEDKYDENTDFNDPMLVYDDEGHLIDCPDGYIDAYGNTPALYTGYAADETDTELISETETIEPSTEESSEEIRTENILEYQLDIPTDITTLDIDISYEKRNIGNTIVPAPSLMLVSSGGAIQTIDGNNGKIIKELEILSAGTWKIKLINAEYYYFDGSYKLLNNNEEAVETHTLDELTEISSTENNNPIDLNNGAENSEMIRSTETT